jgi:hypothetical protein
MSEQIRRELDAAMDSVTETVTALERARVSGAYGLLGEDDRAILNAVFGDLVAVDETMRRPRGV